MALNPAGTVPILVVEGRPPVPGAAIIAEYLDEAVGSELGDRRLLPQEPGPRVEVRRLMSWFNDKFFAEVSGPLTTERLYKRRIPLDAGGGSPDMEAIRAARQNIRYHLSYIGWLERRDGWRATRLTVTGAWPRPGTWRRPTIWAMSAMEGRASRQGLVPPGGRSRPTFRPLSPRSWASSPVADLRADLDF